MHPRSYARKSLWLVAVAALLHNATALAQAEEQELVTAAEHTLTRFMDDPDMVWLRDHFSQSKAVLIAPKLTRAGFFVGVSGGKAVLLARDPDTGRWLGPAFYDLGAVSAGFETGVSISETVALVMSDNGLNKLMVSSFNLGPEWSFAAGPVGRGAKSDILADFVAYSYSKGVYKGLNLHGTIVSIADEWNDRYYGIKVLPPDILMRASAHNAQADGLVALLSQASLTR